MAVSSSAPAALVSTAAGAAHAHTSATYARRVLARAAGWSAIVGLWRWLMMPLEPGPRAKRLQAYRSPSLRR